MEEKKPTVGIECESDGGDLSFFSGHQLIESDSGFELICNGVFAQTLESDKDRGFTTFHRNISLLKKFWMANGVDCFKCKKRLQFKFPEHERTSFIRFMKNELVLQDMSTIERTQHWLQRGYNTSECHASMCLLLAKPISDPEIDFPCEDSIRKYSRSQLPKEKSLWAEICETHARIVEEETGKPPANPPQMFSI